MLSLLLEDRLFRETTEADVVVYYFSLLFIKSGALKYSSSSPVPCSSDSTVQHYRSCQVTFLSKWKSNSCLKSSIQCKSTCTCTIIFMFIMYCILSPHSFQSSEGNSDVHLHLLLPPPLPNFLL